MIHDDTVAFYFVPTVSNIAAPTVAQITAGDRLTKITNYTMSSDEAEVDTSDIDSMYDTTDVGTSKVGPIEITFKYQDNEDMVELLVFRSRGYLIRSRTGSVAATTEVEVYPVTIGKQRPEGYSRNAEQKFAVKFHVHSEPDEHAIVAA